MTEALRKYLKEQGIEYYAVMDYEVLRETNPQIIEREDFTPKSAIIYILPYYAGETVNISRYAASLDYHKIISEINEGIKNALRLDFPEGKMHGYGDHSPIDERHAALIAGLGILGDNGLLINEKYGSYIFIGDVLTDISPELLCAKPPQQIRKCSGCGACKRACPTGVLRGEGGNCLSAITQKKGELKYEEISLMRSYNTVWGCDECQSRCPCNNDPVITPIGFFKRDWIPHLTRELLDMMTKEEFKSRAFAWRGRKTIERNLDLLENANNNCQKVEKQC